MFTYYNVVMKNGKRDYEEKVVEPNFDGVKSLKNLKAMFDKMTENQKSKYANKFWAKFSQLGGVR